MMMTNNVFYGLGQHRNKRAEIHIVNGDEFYIDCFDNDILIAEYKVDKQHSIYYAESMAQNYCDGILKVETWSEKSANRTSNFNELNSQ